MLGSLDNQFAVNCSGEAGDYDRGYIFNRQLLFTVSSLAGQLAVPATNRALWTIYADDVVGHGLIYVVRLVSITAGVEVLRATRAAVA